MVIDCQGLSKKIRELRKAGKTVGLCVGAFDLIHAGHLEHFEAARKFCDVLVVAATCDNFVKAKKGKSRPVFNENSRVYFLSQIRTIDFAVINYFDPATKLIELLKPDFYIKGVDYAEKSDWRLSLEQEAIAAVGGEMRYTSSPKISTTDILNIIKNFDE